MTTNGAPTSRWPASPPWPPRGRLWVATLVVAGLAVLWWNLRQFTTIVAMAVLLAYLLDPAIRSLRRRLGIRRSYAAILVYGAFAFALAACGTLLAPLMARGVMALDPAGWQEATEVFLDGLPHEVTVLQHRLDLEPWLETASLQVQSLEMMLLGRESIVWLLGFATDFAFTVLGVFFTLVLSVYLAADADKTLAWIERKVPSAYHPAYHAVRREIGNVWQAFFRGQLVLVAVIAVATTAGLLALGVEHALWLGLIAGALEVVPRVGPTLAVLPAVVISVTRPSAVFPDLPREWFVLIVILLYVVIQQAENNLLVPRVIGSRVRLPAAVVLIGALAGASLAGIVGVLLAPPVLGSLRVLGSWLLSKMSGDGEQPSNLDRPDGPRPQPAAEGLAPEDAPVDQDRPDPPAIHHTVSAAGSGRELTRRAASSSNRLPAWPFIPTARIARPIPATTPSA